MTDDQYRKLQEYVESPEYEATANEYFAELKRKEDNARNFFKSDRFNELVDLLKTSSTERGHIVADHSLSYNTHPLSSHMTSSELWLMHHAILSNGYPERVDPECAFPATGVVYDGLLFEVTSGQGSILDVSIAPETCYANMTYALTEKVVFAGNGDDVDAVYIDGKRVDVSANILDILAVLGISCRYVNLSEQELKDTLNDIEGVTWNTDTQ